MTWREEERRKAVELHYHPCQRNENKSAQNEIIEDIRKIKDNLDVFVRSDEKDISILESVNGALTQMSDTLAMLNLGVQINPIKNIYITPHFNIATISYDSFDDYIKDAFNPQGSWSEENSTSSVVSVGLTTSYMSLFGPIDMDFSWINDINKIRFFVGIGFQFNRSN